jgi:hypothetical protein
LTAGLVDINDKDKTTSAGKLYPAAELKKKRVDGGVERESPETAELPRSHAVSNDSPEPPFHLSAPKDSQDG